MDDLCRGLGRPGHPSHRLRVCLENDVDFGRAHRIARVRRIVAGDCLQENALRQAHAAVVGEFLRGHDLAARDAGHVRNDRLDLGNAVVAEKLPDLTHHTNTLLRLRAPAARRPKGCEQRPGKWMTHDFPLGMPLHREGKTRRVLHPECFDQAVGGPRFDRQARA